VPLGSIRFSSDPDLQLDLSQEQAQMEQYRERIELVVESTKPIYDGIFDSDFVSINDHTSRRHNQAERLGLVLGSCCLLLQYLIS
jgi:hypothetical protein